MEFGVLEVIDVVKQWPPKCEVFPGNGTPCTDIHRGELDGAQRTAGLEIDSGEVEHLDEVDRAAQRHTDGQATQQA